MVKHSSDLVVLTKTVVFFNILVYSYVEICTGEICYITYRMCDGGFVCLLSRVILLLLFRCFLELTEFIQKLRNTSNLDGTLPREPVSAN